MKDWKVVVLSILVASTFWFFRALNKDHSALISYPIEFVFDKDQAVVMSPLPDVIKIDINSRGWNIFRRTLLFSIEPLRVELENPSEVLFLTRSFLTPIIEEQLQGLKINYILTDTLYLNIERKVSKEINLKVDSLNLSIENGHRVTSPILIEPNSVTLTGPESIINSLESDYYFLPKERNIDENFSRPIKIPIIFENILSFSPNEVRVSFKVSEVSNFTITVPIELKNFPPNRPIQLLDSAITLVYIVEKSVGARFLPDDFQIVLDYELRQSDTVAIPILKKYPLDTMIQIIFDPGEIQWTYHD
ncbi:MAG: hypothetical protein HQ474_07595 [Flammeovirgaceae bacterium]|nr:hypothetical protein [Flammeovirgaceae bacterium]